MNTKAILGVIGAVIAVTVIASVSRSFWFSLMTGGPLVLGVVVIAAFLLGVFLGSQK